MGNRTQAAVTGGGAGTHAYTLDNLYRLTSVTYPGAVTDTYTYDALGNRLTKNATSYTYDDADELTAAGGTSYTYDANGNQLTRGADTFTWDHENRLTQSVVGGVTSSSVYYGNGVRRSHTVNGVTTTYTYDVASSLPVVVQDGTNSLVYGLDLISSTDGAGTRRYFSYDGLGSTSDLTDAAGNVTDTYSYDVFGAVRARTGTNASPWKFTGEQEDGAAGDSGYYFLRARYYDPSIGRFVSRDPLEFDQRYGYASGNPVLHADPSGLCEGNVCEGGGAGFVYVTPQAAAGIGALLAQTAVVIRNCTLTGCVDPEALARQLGTWFAKKKVEQAGAGSYNDLGRAAKRAARISSKTAKELERCFHKDIKGKLRFGSGNENRKDSNPDFGFRDNDDGSVEILDAQGDPVANLPYDCP